MENSLRPAAGAARRNALRISLIYLVAAGAWILTSDFLLSALVNPQRWPRFSTQKGLFFVAATTLILYGLLRRTFGSLEASEERLRTAVEHMPVMMAAFDDAGSVVVWNRECERITRYSADDIIGNPRWMELLFPDPGRRSRMQAEWGARGGEFRDWEWEVACASGAPRIISWASVAGRVPIPGWARWGVGVDITDRRRVEEQFRQAQKMEAVGRLAGGVAHDFNNLLTVIGGYTAVLLATHPSGERGRQQLEQIEKACERAAALTRQLLLFSRKRPLETTVVSLNDIVGDVQKMIARLIGEDIRLVVCPDPAAPCVKADRGLIEQAIINLAVNARDAMPQGGTITLTTAEAVLDAPLGAHGGEIPPGRYALLRVADTGTGMDPETAAQAFEPFFTTKEPGKGTGLGLSTVFGTIRQSGGYVSLVTNPGRGAAFSLFFPPVEGDASPQTASDKAPTGAPRGTVLVVEDEDAVRTLAALILRSRGHTVIEASGGEEALHVCRDHIGPIDVLVTDVIMPGISGGALAGAAVMFRPGLRTVFISGYSDDALVMHGIAANDAAFVQKPFTPEQLAKAVEGALPAE
jgi:PAS domain S-box-containing protein